MGDVVTFPGRRAGVDVPTRRPGRDTTVDHPVADGSCHRLGFAVPR